MGKSAKLHKRKGKSSSSSAVHVKAQANPSTPAVQPPKVAASKNKAAHKSKPRSTGQEGHVLGGADYVTLMMGGRTKARQEALKLPTED